jgi:hypothetical protein
MIDRHNRCRQDTLGIEQKIGTWDWDKRVNFSVLSMCIVDAWLTWKALHAVMTQENTEDQQTFYSLLVEEMIDSNIDSRARRLRTSAPEHL